MILMSVLGLFLHQKNLIRIHSEISSIIIAVGRAAEVISVIHKKFFCPFNVVKILTILKKFFKHIVNRHTENGRCW